MRGICGDTASKEGNRPVDGVRFTMRLYGLAAISCLMWLIQSSYRALGDGSLWTPANCFFSLSILIAAIYTGHRFLVLRRGRDASSEKVDSAKSA